MNRDLIPQLEPLLECLRSWTGSLLHISEDISRNPGNYDRHFTTSSKMVMRLRYVGLAISGSTLNLMGDVAGVPAQYEATIDLLELLTIGSREIMLMERFGSEAERRSVITVVEEQSH